MALGAWQKAHPGVTVDTSIVMPDHTHAIIVLANDPLRTLSLSDVIHRYKSLTTKLYSHGVREQGWTAFAGRLWQDAFHDHIIRTDEDLEKIRRYVIENPLRWELRKREAL